MADREQGRRPENRPGGDDSDPGLASRKERDPTATKRITFVRAWTASMRKGAGAQKQWSELSKITIPLLNGDITHATDVLIVGKPLPENLSVDLVVVFCLPSVAPSALCRRACKVYRFKSSYLSLSSLFPH